MGIMSVSIEELFNLKFTVKDVSVPYGDHVCLNWTVYEAKEHGIETVSVPYGDHVCLNNIVVR